jgi:hypothetical protein
MATKHGRKALEFQHIEPRSSTLVDGEDTVVFSPDEIKLLSQPFQYTLVGTFVGFRPSLAAIDQQIKKQVLLFDSCFPSAIDDNHILLRFCNEKDFLAVYLKSSWIISGRRMMVTHRSPSFKPTAHSPCLPVWLGFPQLRAHLQTPEALRSIAGTVGKVLKLHDNVHDFTRPGFAQVCVEVDFSKELKRSVRILNGNEIIYQPVMFPEPIPDFCHTCCRLGHKTEFCSKNPHQLAISVNSEEQGRSPGESQRESQ